MPQDATHSSPSASLKDSEDLAKNADNEGLTAVKHADDALLAKLGYQSVFKREFSVSLTSLLCIVLSVLLSYELSR